uniref:G-protein coupled receptors family 1 profile domain-containing protein n=1 Tax=Globodera rostochiensis TaxID=31243 RepID=A0A914HRH3_GLORO
MLPSIDPLYMNKGFVPREIVTTGVIAMICCVGISLNSSLVYVTIKTKSLHSPCLILVALYAFFGSFLLFGNCVKFVIFVFGINYITLRTCFYIQIVPIIGTAITLTLQLCIGLDRLIGVIFPFWYKANGKKVAFKFAIGICCIRSILNGVNAYIGSSRHWKKPVMCILGDPSQQPENQYFSNLSALVVYCGEFLCYTLILLIMWRRKPTIPQNVKKLTLSLSVLMSIGLICYLLNTIFSNVIMPFLNLDAFTIENFVLQISFALQSMAYGSSAPVLYFCNTQYRRAFRTQFAEHLEEQIIHKEETPVAQLEELPTDWVEDVGSSPTRG